MENKLEYTTIYSVDRKGALVFVDILCYSRKQKKAIFTNDKIPDPNFGVTETRVPNRLLVAKLKSLEKKGYEIEHVDGANERVSKEEVLDALHLKYNKEKVCELCKLRPEVYPYYSLDLITKVLRKYVHDELEDLYLDYWSTLYIRCLYESYNIEKEKMQSFFIASVCHALEELDGVLSKELDHEQKVQLVHTVFQEIKKAEEVYAEMRSKSEKKKNKLKANL